MVVPVPEEERIAMFDVDVEDELDGKRNSTPLYRYSKLTGLVVCWIFLMVILTTKSERNMSSLHQISVPEREIRSYWLMRRPYMQQISLEVEGAFLPHYYGNLSKKWMTIWVEMVQTKQSANNSDHDNLDVFYSQRISPEWIIPLVSEKLIDDVPEMRHRNLFNMYEFDTELATHSMIRFQFKTNLATTFPLAISYDLSPIDPEDGIVYAAYVLLGLYILIIFEIVHRTIAAILGAAMSVAILALLNERPTKMEMVSWVDVETLLLLFSMMILVAILAKSGVFDYLAVLAYKFTNGKIWPLVNTLCFFTALISSILDNVTTVLLMTPVTIRLCEVVELNPVPILMAMIMYSNIGGAITPIGDPPNVIIAMNEDIVNAGVDFGTFIIHMGIPLIIVMFCVHIQLRYMFRNICDLGFPECQDIQELRHEINVWRRAAESLSSYSKDEEIVRISLEKKVRMLMIDLKEKLNNKSVAIDKYTANLEELQSKYPIRDGWLLLKSGLALCFVITMFFLHSLPDLNLSLGWAALLGALLLLILSDKEHIESVFARVEWSTLIFFGALFILMEALARLGLIDWIGHQTEWVILQVNPEYRLAVALLLILWVSGIASAFVDNIPLTTMMVKIISRLSQKEELHLPLQPLVWALALGACLGGNGTLIGASANVVCAGVAEQHGYRFSFMQFLKLGFPVTLMSISVTSIYLMIVHVWLGWNG